MRFLAEVAFEAFDRVVCEEYVDVAVMRYHLVRERVHVRRERGVETHSCYIDGFVRKVEFLACRGLFLYEVDVSGPCVDGEG